MKKLILLLLFIPLVSYSQIPVVKVADEKEIKTIEYDSLKNFLGENYSNYIGQDLFLRPKNEKLRKYGYENFKLDPEGSSYSDSNIYKKNKKAESNYEELQSKVFTVLDVMKDPSRFSKYAYLKLKFKDNEDVVFFRYSKEYSHSFPFTVMGYFEKSKDIFVGNEVLIRDFKNKSAMKITDISNGEVLNIGTDKYYKCLDVTLDGKSFNLVLLLETETKQKFTFKLSNIFLNIPRILLKDEAESYKAKFGNSYWESILNEEVMVGFTEEMTLLSWGKPKKINRSSSGDQWVYSSQYLYFENGIMQSFN
tara:strand:- start:13 stop:936 length:924 start_codon:yes stop_codon:yes gene_type:complete